MKIPDGVTIHVKGHKYKGEIPDDLMPKALKTKRDKKTKTTKVEE